jgi:hypothetical protein
MQRREDLSQETSQMNWTPQMPSINSNQSISPSLINQNSTDPIDDSDLLLLNDANFDTDDMQDLFGDEMISQFDECLQQDFDSNLVPILESNLLDNSMDGTVPTTSTFISANTIPTSSVLARKLSRSESHSNRLQAKTLDESDLKVASFMARIPFRSTNKIESGSFELDFGYSAEIDVGLHLRKFDYLQLCELIFK